jgi:hypothetical protein
VGFIDSVNNPGGYSGTGGPQGPVPGSKQQPSIKRPGGSGGFFLFPAGVADTETFDPVSDHFILLYPADGFPHVHLGFRLQVVDLAALQTANMRMIHGITVKAFLVPHGFQFLNHALLRQNFQVAVHRAQAYSRKALPDHLVNLVHRRVRRDFPQFFQYDSALACHPEIHPWRQYITPSQGAGFVSKIKNDYKVKNFILSSQILTTMTIMYNFHPNIGFTGRHALSCGPVAFIFPLTKGLLTVI